MIADPLRLIDNSSEVSHYLNPLTAAQFLGLELPPRKLILSPWLHEKGLTMIVAPRGI